MSDRKVLMDERIIPEKEGLLGGKTTSMGADGSILKEIKTPFCDCCGLPLKDTNPALCFCRRKICPSCTIIHCNRAFCRECAKQITAITKQDFFALYGIAHDASLGDIKHCSLMSSENLDKSLAVLKERGLITCKGISFFARYAITDNGLAILATAEQIYQGEGDVNRFLSRIQEAIEEG